MDKAIPNFSAAFRGFRTSVWLCPLAFVLHVLEEMQGFTPWVQRHINPDFTQSHYLVVHLSGITGGFLLAGLASKWQNRVFLFLYLSLFLLPGQMFNILFHLGATLYYGAYSPGLITALVLYPPVVSTVVRNAVGEELISRNGLAAALILAGFFHAADVWLNVYRFGK